jgi:hypothetical protein
MRLRHLRGKRGRDGGGDNLDIRKQIGSSAVHALPLVVAAKHSVHCPLHYYIEIHPTTTQPRKLIFSMKPYFDPTRKTTSTKKWKTT